MKYWISGLRLFLAFLIPAQSCPLKASPPPAAHCVNAGWTQAALTAAGLLQHAPLHPQPTCAVDHALEESGKESWAWHLIPLAAVALVAHGLYAGTLHASAGAWGLAFFVVGLIMHRYDKLANLTLTARERQHLRVDLGNRLKILELLAKMPGKAFRFNYELRDSIYRKFVIELRADAPADAIKINQELEIPGRTVKFRVTARDGRMVSLHQISGFDEAIPATGMLIAGTSDVTLKKQIEALKKVLDDMDVDALLGKPMEVRTSLHRLFAMADLSTASAERVIPKKEFIDRRIPYEEFEGGTRGDEAQEMTVQIAFDKPQVTFVEGPPGTGKSALVAEIVRQAVRRGLRVHVVSRMHTAVDNVIDELKENGTDTPIPILRMGNDPNVFKESSRSYWPGRAVLTRDGKRTDLERSAIRNDVVQRFQEDRARVPTRFGKAGYAFFFTDTASATDSYLSTMRAITPSSGQADLIIMDESSIENVPGAMVPLQYLAVDGNVILVGDSRQLPPHRLSDEERAYLKKAGITDDMIDSFETSIFDFLLKRSHGDRIRLLTNYRSKRRIVEGISDWFYDNTLRAHDTSPEDPDELIAIDIAQDAKAEDYFEDPENPETNFKSLREVLRLVEFYHAPAPAGKGLPLNKITIVSGYQAQVELIEDALAKKYGGPGINASELPIVSTIDGVMGDQNTAVIVDFMCSNPKGRIGFIKDPRRLNVALSRARDYLAIVWDTRVFSERAGKKDSAADRAIRPVFTKIRRYFDLHGSARFSKSPRAARPAPPAPAPPLAALVLPETRPLVELFSDEGDAILRAFDDLVFRRLTTAVTLTQTAELLQSIGESRSNGWAIGDYFNALTQTFEANGWNANAATEALIRQAPKKQPLTAAQEIRLRAFVTEWHRRWTTDVRTRLSFLLDEWAKRNDVSAFTVWGNFMRRMPDAALRQRGRQALENDVRRRLSTADDLLHEILNAQEIEKDAAELRLTTADRPAALQEDDWNLIVQSVILPAHRARIDALLNRQNAKAVAELHEVYYHADYAPLYAEIRDGFLRWGDAALRGPHDRKTLRGILDVYSALNTIPPVTNAPPFTDETVREFINTLGSAFQQLLHERAIAKKTARQPPKQETTAAAPAPKKSKRDERLPDRWEQEAVQNVLTTMKLPVELSLPLWRLGTTADTLNEKARAMGELAGLEKLPARSLRQLALAIQTALNPSWSDDFKSVAIPTVPQEFLPSVAAWFLPAVQQAPSNKPVLIFLPDANFINGLPKALFEAKHLGLIYIITTDRQAIERTLLAEYPNTSANFRYIAGDIDLLLGEQLIKDLDGLAQIVTPEDAGQRFDAYFAQRSENPALEEPGVFSRLPASNFGMTFTLRGPHLVAMWAWAALERRVIRRWIQEGKLPPDTALPKTPDNRIDAKQAISFFNNFYLLHNISMFKRTAPDGTFGLFIDKGIGTWDAYYDSQNSKKIKVHGYDTADPATLWAEPLRNFSQLISEQIRVKPPRTWSVSPDDTPSTTVRTGIIYEGALMRKPSAEMSNVATAQQLAEQILEIEPLRELTAGDPVRLLNAIREELNAHDALTDAPESLRAKNWHMARIVMQETMEPYKTIGESVVIILGMPGMVWKIWDDLWTSDRFPKIHVFTLDAARTRQALDLRAQGMEQAGDGAGAQALRRRLGHEIQVIEADLLMFKPKVTKHLEKILSTKQKRHETLTALMAYWMELSKTSMLDFVNLPGIIPGTVGLVLNVETYPTFCMGLQRVIERSVGIAPENAPLSQSTWIKNVEIELKGTTPTIAHPFYTTISPLLSAMALRLAAELPNKLIHPKGSIYTVHTIGAIKLTEDDKKEADPGEAFSVNPQAKHSEKYLYDHPYTLWGFRMNETWLEMDRLLSKHKAYRSRSLLAVPDSSAFLGMALLVEHMMLLFNIRAEEGAHLPEEHLTKTAV